MPWPKWKRSNRLLELPPLREFSKMASMNLLRACQGAKCLFLGPRIMSKSLPAITQSHIPNKQLSLSPQHNITPPDFLRRATPDYFKARRGPFTPEEKRGDHKMMASTHWKIERILAISMIGVMPAALFVQGPIMDFMLSTTVLLHGFWGVDGVLTDYLEKFLPFIHWPWYIITIMGLAGLLYFNYNDVGVCKAIQMVWRL